MILIYLLLVLIAHLGVQSNVVDVPVGTILMQEKRTSDDHLYAIKSCDKEHCGLEQFICKKNFLLPANKISSATATVVFKLNYKIEYMGERIFDVAEFPFTLDKNYYSFTFRYGKGSSIRLSASKTCRTMDGNYFDTNCHYHCERRNWDAKTNRERIEWETKAAPFQDSDFPQTQARIVSPLRVVLMDHALFKMVSSTKEPVTVSQVTTALNVTITPFAIWLLLAERGNACGMRTTRLKSHVNVKLDSPAVTVRRSRPNHNFAGKTATVRMEESAYKDQGRTTTVNALTDSLAISAKFLSSAHAINLEEFLVFFSHFSDAQYLLSQF
ncbi:hypothetical protein CAEBREN_21616 [Caenorhabditis brenneri]|uniref:Uncharacterized protein n=1 Tax=Caenorhabditis brenneri TaxID=135651 RepID=G0N1V8_CAEBE|nr:hypothetical protein CAEBREN_21616 [Caenorhabditis brenneri]